MKQRVDGYVRVSCIGGRAGDGYISREVQREQISAFAGLMGVEIDAWHDDPLSREDDAERQALLEQHRYRVVRVTWRQAISRRGQTASRIAAALARG